MAKFATVFPELAFPGKLIYLVLSNVSYYLKIIKLARSMFNMYPGKLL